MGRGPERIALMVKALRAIIHDNVAVDVAEQVALGKRP